MVKVDLVGDLAVACRERDQPVEVGLSVIEVLDEDRRTLIAIVHLPLEVDECAADSLELHGITGLHLPTRGIRAQIVDKDAVLQKLVPVRDLPGVGHRRRTAEGQAINAGGEKIALMHVGSRLGNLHCSHGRSSGHKINRVMGHLVVGKFGLGLFPPDPRIADEKIGQRNDDVLRNVMLDAIPDEGFASGLYRRLRRIPRNPGWVVDGNTARLANVVLVISILIEESEKAVPSAADVKICGN